MLGLIFAGVTIAMVTGATWKLILDKTKSRHRITRNEFIAGTLALTVLLVPLTAFVGTKVATSSNSKFHEYWNGWEIAAEENITTCTRDGVCRHTYDCDPYTVTETYTTTDADGNIKTETRLVTKWHSCPVGDHEADYIVRTTVGDAVISRGQFTPHTKPWRPGRGLGNVPTTAPAAWQAAKNRIDADNPGPATAVHTYDNWILASELTLLKQHSAVIDTYRDAGLLPTPAAGVHGHYHADKAHFVGWEPTPQEAAQWQDAVARTAAALGTQKQGDLQVVLVHTDEVTDPDAYTSALMASWQDPTLGRDRLAKNAVVMVAGTTDGTTTAWARVDTGMPIGNRELKVAAPAALAGAPWTPEDLVGAPAVTLTTGTPEPVTTAAQGALERLLWDEKYGFTRECMTCGDEGEEGGFAYLKDELKPTTGQNLVIVAVMTALAAAVWGAAAAFGDHRTVAPVRHYLNTGHWSGARTTARRGPSVPRPRTSTPRPRVSRPRGTGTPARRTRGTAQRR